MNLLIDATSVQSKRFAGIGQYTESLISNMTFNPSNSTGYILYDSSPYNETLFDPIKKEGRLNLYKISNILGKSPFAQGYALNKLTDEVRKKDKNLVYFSPYFLSGFPTNGIPMVMMIHDLALLKFNYYSDRGGFYGTVRKLEYKSWLPKTALSDRIITNSHFTKSEFLKYMPDYPEDKIIPIHLGIDLVDEESPDFEKHLPADWREKGYVIYLGGGIQKNKNSEGVVNAYKVFVDTLVSEGKELGQVPYLVIAGKIFLNMESQESKKLHELITQFGLNEKVRFTGFYEDKDKYSLLKNSLLFVHLSLYEGFGIAVGEAMRAGTAVVVDKNSSYPEVVGDTGLLVDGHDPVESGNAIYKLYNDRGLAVTLGAQARERSMQFSWSETAKKTFQVLKDVYEERYPSVK